MVMCFKVCLGQRLSAINVWNKIELPFKLFLVNWSHSEATLCMGFGSFMKYFVDKTSVLIFVLLQC